MITLTTTRDEPRADSRDLATRLKNRHKSVVELIDRYSDSLKRFGHLPFQTEVGERRQGGGRAQRFALLNENQALFLLSLSRNTDYVVSLKADLIQAFADARAAIQARATEYRPSYRALHDLAHDLAAGSPNERFVHMNLNKLVNGTVGIAAGQRQSLPAPEMALTVVAQSLAARAMAGAKDHRHGYQLAKAALGRLQEVLAVLGGSAPALKRGRHE